jgi:hypothetical protein
MNKTLLYCCLVCILLASCAGGTQPVPTQTPPNPSPSLSLKPAASSTPLPSVTPTATLRPSPSFSLPTDVPFPTKTPLPPYPNKQIVLDYFEWGGFSDINIFFNYEKFPESYNWFTDLVLYSDGQLILAGNGYVEKTLSPSEVHLLLSKIESQGFFMIETNQKHDQDDKLYDFKGQFQESHDGSKTCILLNTSQSRNLCIYNKYQQYLIPSMKSILRILDDYHPADMQPYIPDRILLSVKVLDPKEDTLPAIIPAWDANIISLDTQEGFIDVREQSSRVAFISGETARKIYQFFIMNRQEERIFSQNGKVYLVGVEVLLPHTRVTNSER